MPRRGLVGLVGTGVGMAAEYRQHRKDQKLSRENSQQSDTAVAGSSSGTLPTERQVSSPPDLPPTYSDAVEGTNDRSLSSGKPVSTDKKAALAQYDEESSSSSDDDSVEDDEEDWQLDEALERSNSSGLPTYEESEQPYAPVDELVSNVMVQDKTALAAAPSFVRTPLPCPVIIPQRRPRKKERGFVHAYAPLLGECSGIDQETFISFLDNFYRSSQASPVFPIIRISAAIAGLAPSVIAMAVTTAVQVAAGVGQEVQARSRTNHFLDQMNEELFKPAGLYAMIVKYKSQADIMQSQNSLIARFGVAGEVIDFNSNQAVAKYDRTLSDESSGSGSRSMSDRMKNLRLASGSTHGAVHLPEAAPLIFPAVDKAIAKDGPETFKDKSKDAKDFLADYMDRRAQIAYARDDPNSSLNIPEEKRAFRSKYSDPDHPMFNNGLVGFASGGYIAPGQARGQRRFEKDERRALRYEQRMQSGRGLTGKQQRRYDRTLAEEEYYGGGVLSGYGGSGRRRPRGPIGLVSGLVGAAMGGRGFNDASASRNREYEDAHDPHLGTYGGEKEMRRSFDDRRRSPAPPAPYDASVPPAPYGVSTLPAPHGASAPHAPYGGQSSSRPQYSCYGGSNNSGQDPRRYRRQGVGPLGMVKRVMREDVLYLMIVNMPSEAELAEARELLAKAKSEK